MKKYVSLYLSFFKASFMADMEYRFNIVTKIITDLLWYAAQASVFEVLFYHTHQISNWNLASARVFLATLFFMDAIWMVIFHENFEKLSGKIRRGELDLLLVKPVNSQFMITMQKQNTSYVINSILTLCYLVWTVSFINPAVPVWKFIFYLVIGLPSAQLILYSFRLAFATLSIFFSNAESVNYLWYQIYRLGMRPDSFYPKWLRYFVLSLLPMGFIASVPTRMLIHPFSWWMMLAGPWIGFCLLMITGKLWNKALRSYSSASS